uniref:Uncharacterized protein n=1 Tax=Chlorocebus sabaeus TaxID=60711 RepID=A0A0D9R783_CHLSB
MGRKSPRWGRPLEEEGTLVKKKTKTNHSHDRATLVVFSRAPERRMESFLYEDLDADGAYRCVGPCARKAMMARTGVSATNNWAHPCSSTQTAMLSLRKCGRLHTLLRTPGSA